MSNRNRNNQNQGNGNQNGGVPAQQQPPKQTLRQRIVSGYHKFRSTKLGTWTVRIGKAAGVAGACYGSYRLGEKHAKPTVVTVTPIEPEEITVEEEEASEEPVGEQE